MTTSSSAKNRLVVFVKAPVPGQVKTRLVPPLTPEGACGLYRSWARDLFRRAGAWGGSSVDIAYAPHASSPSPDWLDGGRPVSFFPQTGRDLGEKMTHAFRNAFQSGAERVVIVGSDSPGLPVDYLAQAFRFLEEAPLVIGPARDGGYYLVGLRRPCPELFESIPWSTAEVLPRTLDRAARLGLSVRLLPEYFDVDRPADLELIPKESRAPVSVILPVRDEESRIAATLRGLRDAAGDSAELIVVDGGSRDGTVRAVSGLADQVLTSPPGRGTQMHLGARASTGSILLFLHADTELPPRWPDLLRRIFLENPRPPAATAFRLSFDSSKPFYRTCASFANLRTRWTGVPHGDQAIAVRRDAYFAAGGFPEVPLMEEYLLLPRLKELGEVRILPERVVTSSRRYEARGPLRNALRNQVFLLLFHLGMPPERLARWY